MSKSEWSNNNLAHVQTWFNLKLLNEHKRSFEQAKDLKISQLNFYKELGSPQDKRRNAEALVIPLMNLYETIGKAGFEPGVTKAKAKERLVNVLVQQDNTMVDLAGAADACYHFKGEGGVL